MNSKGKEIAEAVEAEVAKWPGVRVAFVEGSKHPRAKLAFDGKFLSVAMPGTASDYRSLLNTVSDVRKALRSLGAERAEAQPKAEDEEETAKRAYSKPNDGAAKRPDPVVSGPAPIIPSIADKLEQVLTIPQDNGGHVGMYVGAVDPDKEAERAKFKARVAAIEDGIYFGLEDKVYHAVEALGSGSIGQLLISPGTFWRGSWLDPETEEAEPDEDATKAQIIGRAYHAARLEPDLFVKQYVRGLDKADFPACKIWNGTQVGDALAELGEPKKKGGENVAEQAQRLEDAGYTLPIWPLEQARFEARVAKLDPRPIVLPADVWDDIERDASRIHAQPEIHALLSTGVSEVSVFWTDEDGTRCKARFDKLGPEGWVDLKTFANARGVYLDQAIADAFRYNRYYVQAVHYRDAAELIRAGSLEIRGEATDDQVALIETIRQRPIDMACWYVFQEKGGIPNLLAKRFKFRSVDIVREHEIAALMLNGTPAERQMAEEAMSQITMIHRRGRYEIDRAKQQFRLYSEVYQRGEPWAPIDAIGTIDDLDFNPYWLEGKQ